MSERGRTLFKHHRTLFFYFCFGSSVKFLKGQREYGGGILIEALAMGEVGKQDVRGYQRFYLAHSCQRSSSALSKSTPSGDLPRVLAITVGNGL